MYCWLRIRHFWLMRHCRSYPAKWNRFLWWKTVAKWSKNRTTLKIAFPENIRCNQALFLLLPMSNGLLTSHQIFLANQALKNIAEVTPAKWNRFLWWKAIAKWSKNGTALKIAFHKNIHVTKHYSYYCPYQTNYWPLYQAFLTNEALKNIAEVTLQNLADFFDGKPLQNEVKTGQL